MTNERTPFTSPLGGVMTREVGTICGDLEAWLDGSSVAIAYVGVLDVYHVKGQAPAGASIEEIVAWLSRDPGIGEDDNPRYTDLTDYASAPAAVSDDVPPAAVGGTAGAQLLA